METRAVVLAVAIFLAGGAATEWLPKVETGDPAQRRGFMYDDREAYEAYGCTAMGWAGASKAASVAAAHAAGVRHFCCSVGFLTEFTRVIDFDPNFLDAAGRNSAGRKFTTAIAHAPKGEPVTLRVTTDGAGITTVVVPELDLWTILELR